MSRLIDADKLIEQIKKTYCEGCDNYNGMRCKACPNDDEIGDIDSAPTIDAIEVVHGEWKAKSFHEVYCDNCGFTFDIIKCDFLENMKFCPNCGARMKGAEDE